MRVIMINRQNMSATELPNVTTITASGNVYILAFSTGGTATYSKDDWYISILWT